MSVRAFRLSFTRKASLFASSLFLSSSFALAMSTQSRVIDSHLHVWASADEATSGFPYLQEPPASLANKASTSELLRNMDENGVDGALIVQPINHKYDHSYVIEAMKLHPERLKGMMLHDPSLDKEDAVARLEALALKGFVGVRFNPYLWPKNGDSSWEPMSQGAGLAVFKRCAELKMPVGIMCFQGLQLHYDDILELLKASPQTMVVLDHFGFTSVKNAAAFDQLLTLAAYPNVSVKISALFRLDDPSPFEQVRKERFEPLLKAFGAERLLFGSDFPFVLEQPQSYSIVKLVSSWVQDPEDRKAILGGTTERLFGPWGSRSTA